jgi:hypothetical protein
MSHSALQAKEILKRMITASQRRAVKSLELNEPLLYRLPSSNDFRTDMYFGHTGITFNYSVSLSGNLFLHVIVKEERASKMNQTIRTQDAQAPFTNGTFVPYDPSASDQHSFRSTVCKFDISLAGTHTSIGLEIYKVDPSRTLTDFAVGPFKVQLEFVRSFFELHITEEEETRLRIFGFAYECLGPTDASGLNHGLRRRGSPPYCHFAPVWDPTIHDLISDDEADNSTQTSSSVLRQGDSARLTRVAESHLTEGGDFTTACGSSSGDWEFFPSAELQLSSVQSPGFPCPIAMPESSLDHIGFEMITTEGQQGEVETNEVTEKNPNESPALSTDTGNPYEGLEALEELLASAEQGVAKHSPMDIVKEALEFSGIPRPRSPQCCVNTSSNNFKMPAYQEVFNKRSTTEGAFRSHHTSQHVSSRSSSKLPVLSYEADPIGPFQYAAHTSHNLSFFRRVATKREWPVNFSPPVCVVRPTPVLPSSSEEDWESELFNMADSFSPDVEDNLEDVESEPRTIPSRLSDVTYEPNARRRRGTGSRIRRNDLRRQSRHILDASLPATPSNAWYRLRRL